MALTVKMRKSKAGDDGTTVGTYYGHDGSWSYEIHVPRGIKLDTADIYFVFEDEEERE